MTRDEYIRSLSSRASKLEEHIEYWEEILRNIDVIRINLAKCKSELEDVQSKLNKEYDDMEAHIVSFEENQADWAAIELETKLSGQRLRERRYA